MKTANDFQAMIIQTGNKYGINVFGAIEIKLNSVPDAKQQSAKLTLLQKELKQIKKEIAIAIKSIRAAYVAKKAQVQSSAPLTSLLHVKGAGRMRAASRNSLTSHQNAAIAPYTAVSATIDRIVLALDNLKLQIQTWIAKQAA